MNNDIDTDLRRVKPDWGVAESLSGMRLKDLLIIWRKEAIKKHPDLAALTWRQFPEFIDKLEELR